jgi:Zn-dependent protease
MATASPSTSFNPYGMSPRTRGGHVAEAPSVQFGTPVMLFLATMATTCMMGARFAANFAVGLPPIARFDDMLPIGWILEQPSRLVDGIPFSFTILTILLAHELGHYCACRRHKVEASLPYFLPAPTLSGTAGAVIRLRGRIPNRRALLDIGISGPFWGFMASIPLIFLGLLLSVGSAQGNSFIASCPPIFWIMNELVQVIRPNAPAVNQLLFHPVLLACWIGMFVTFLNLLPAGQLDGGHVMYSIFPRMHRSFTNLLILGLIVASVFLWIGWLFWAVLLMMPFMRHPKVKLDEPITGQARWLVWVAFALLILTVMPAPFAHSSLQYFLR